MSDPRQIDLPESLTIRNVTECCANWSALDTSADLTINATEVVEVDTAGLQLLLAVTREQVGCGNQVTWKVTDGKFRDVVAVLGMNSVLGIE